MNLGWLDVCLRVREVASSRLFYEALGFVRVEGEDEEGWAVMVVDETRIGLYEPQHMGDDAFLLNFRGGDVMAISQQLIEAGVTFKSGPTTTNEGVSATVLDPGGHPIFFDTAHGETKKLLL